MNSYITFLIIVLKITFVVPAFCEDKSIVFSTWEGFEVDKCASIWLIKKFIDSNIKIKFYPKGTVIKDGIQFDTPNAELRRYHNLSTFETIIKKYKIQNSRLDYIAKIIHDIEINLWDYKVMQKTNHVKDSIISIITSAKNDKTRVIEESKKYFDHFYKNVNVNPTNTDGKK